MMTVRAAALMRAMIDRGLPTGADTGGADWGVRDGVAQGLLPGPRMFIAGRAIGPTGGHSDAGRRTDTGSGRWKGCNAMRFWLEVVDGVDAVRAAVREQLRQGVDQIKIMVSGGVASPYDPLDSRQFSLEEIRTAVEEAEAFGRYTQAHAYTPEAITRAVSQGVRTVEHGNLIDEKSAALMKEKGAYLVANLVTYYAMRERAKDFGMTSEMLAKNDLVIDGGLKSLEICKRAGVQVAYGSDLLGQLQVEQSREFLLRRENRRSRAQAGRTTNARGSRKNPYSTSPERGSHPCRKMFVQWNWPGSSRELRIGSATCGHRWPRAKGIWTVCSSIADATAKDFR